LTTEPTTDEPTCPAHLAATDGGPDLKCASEPGVHIHHRTADGTTFERLPFGLGALSSKPKS